MKYLKLKDGESIKGILPSEKLTFYQIWVDKKPLPASKGDPGAKFRFKTNFVTEDGEALILEQGSNLFFQILELEKDWDLKKTIVKITRKGEEMQTRYSIQPTQNTATEKMLSVPLSDVQPPKDKIAVSSGSGDDDDGLPF